MKGLLAGLVALMALGVLFFFYTAEKAPPPEMTEAEMTEIEAEVREQLTNRLDEYGKALGAGDAQAVMSFWTSDARMWQQGWYGTAEDLAAFLEEAFPSMTYSGLSMEPLDLFVHGDVAYFIYEYSGTIQTEGQEPESMINNCFTRFEKEDGVWKLDRDVCGPRDAPTEG